MKICIEINTKLFKMDCIQSTKDVGDFMRLRAYAKINLGLDILGKRSDGYHEVK